MFLSSSQFIVICQSFSGAHFCLFDLLILAAASSSVSDSVALLLPLIISSVKIHGKL